MILDKLIIVVVCCLATAAAVEADNNNKEEAVRTARNVLLPPYYDNGQYRPYNHHHHTHYPWNHYNNYNPNRYYAPHSRIPFTGAVNPNDYRSPVLYSNDVRHPDGSYFYEFETANGIRRGENSVQTHDDNVVQGSYSHVGPDGRTYTVNYIADKNGYRAVGDHLPQQPQASLTPSSSSSLHRHPIVVVTTPKPISAGHNKVIVAPIGATAFPPFNYQHPAAYVHPNNIYVSPYSPYSSTPRPFLAGHGFQHYGRK